MIPPRLTSLIDQAAAAGSEGIAHAEGLAREKHGRVEWEPANSPGFHTRLISAVRYLASMRIVGFCEHAAAVPAQPMFWTPYHPDLIRCRICHNEQEQMIHGTEDDARCDMCGRLAPGAIYCIAVQDTAIVLVLGEQQAARGPLMVSFGLCPDCHRKEGYDDRV